MWFRGLVTAVLTVVIGLWSLSATLLGQAVDATVQSCETELQAGGRFVWNVTDWEVTTLGVDGQPTTTWVETQPSVSRGHRAHPDCFRGTYADPTLNSYNCWLVPLGLADAVGTWWMGLPSQVDDTYCRHDAPRPRRRR
jgi:hypothetical protein